MCKCSGNINGCQNKKTICLALAEKVLTDRNKDGDDDKIRFVMRNRLI